MTRQNPPPGVFADDLRLLSQEVGRCRAILGKLASLGEDGAGPLDELSLSHLIEEIAAPHRHFGVVIAIDLDGQGRAGMPPESRHALRVGQYRGERR